VRESGWQYGRAPASLALPQLENADLRRATEADLRCRRAFHSNTGRHVEGDPSVVVEAGRVLARQAHLRDRRTEPGQHHLAAVRVAGQQEIGVRSDLAQAFGEIRAPGAFRTRSASSVVSFPRLIPAVTPINVTERPSCVTTRTDSPVRARIPVSATTAGHSMSTSPCTA
jgi:hypothetical protein